MTARAPLAATTLATELTCAGCGYRIPDDTLAQRCPRVRPGDDTDHVLRRVLEVMRAC